MIKYDGHECIHELLNNKKGSVLDTIRVKNCQLKLTDSICFEASFINLAFLAAGFVDEVYADHPNIKHIMVYRTKKDYLDPGFAIQRTIDSFNEWKDKISSLPIKVELHDMCVSKQKYMSKLQWKLAHDHIQNLYWSIDGNDELYFVTDDLAPNCYYKMYKVLNEYNQDYTIQTFHTMIEKQLVEYPKIKDTINTELDWYPGKSL